MEIKLQKLEEFLLKWCITISTHPVGGFIIADGKNEYTIQDVSNDETTTILPRMMDEERLIVVEQ